MKKLSYQFLVLILLFLTGCQETLKEKEECLKFVDEKYAEQKMSRTEIIEAHKSHKNMLKMFDEKSVKGLNYEAYQLQIHSAHGYGKSVKFEKKKGGYFLSVKCQGENGEFRECKEYQIEIEIDEWNELEKMIYEFNFWTTEDFRANEHVLDGQIFFLEGNRPEAEKCNKKTYKLGHPS